MRSHLSSLLASLVPRYSKQAIYGDATVAFCNGLGQPPLPSCEAEWQSLIQCAQLQTHIHTHTHSSGLEEQAGAHSICNLFYAGKDWSEGFGAQFCVCVCACARVRAHHFLLSSSCFTAWCCHTRWWWTISIHSALVAVRTCKLTWIMIFLYRWFS